MANSKTTNKNAIHINKNLKQHTGNKHHSLKMFLAQALKILTYWDRYHDKWVPVTTAWHVFSLWLEEWPPIWRVAANILNKQPTIGGPPA
jgi:hypothetical protein